MQDNKNIKGMKWDSLIYHDGKYTSPSRYAQTVDMFRLCEVPNYKNFHVWFYIRKEYAIGESDFRFSTNHYFGEGSSKDEQMRIFNEEFFLYCNSGSKQNIIHIKDKVFLESKIHITYADGKVLKLGDESGRPRYDVTFELYEDNPIVKFEIFDLECAAREKSVYDWEIDLSLKESQLYYPEREFLLDVQTGSGGGSGDEIALYFLNNSDYFNKENRLGHIALGTRRIRDSQDDWMHTSLQKVEHFQASRHKGLTWSIWLYKGSTVKEAMLNYKLVKYYPGQFHKFHIGDREFVFKLSKLFRPEPPEFKEVIDGCEVEISNNDIISLIEKNGNKVTLTDYVKK